MCCDGLFGLEEGIYSTIYQPTQELINEGIMRISKEVYDGILEKGLRSGIHLSTIYHFLGFQTVTCKYPPQKEDLIGFGYSGKVEELEK